MGKSIIQPSEVNINTGLNFNQVDEQKKMDQQNTAQHSLTRSVSQILKDNILTPFNFINIILGVLVFYTGSYKNLLFLGIAFFNTGIGVIQELRSKRQIDKMAILAEGTLKVLRQSEVLHIKPEEIVLGDILLLNRGDQIPVDGKVVQSNSMEVDESQITGESTTITKKTGDHLTSGSFLVSGSGKMSVTKVGKHTFVNHLSDKARSGNDTKSILLTTINKIIKVLTFIIIPLGVALFISKILGGASINRSILGAVAAMVGMIPEGLVLLTSMTLAVSALKLAREKTLVRDLPAIETLARVDTIFLDKTGTITSGELKYARTIALSELSVDQINQLACGIVIGTGDENETAIAITEAIPNPQLSVNQVIPFSSERKWSGVEFSDGNKYVLGAPQFISSSVPSDTITGYAKQGYRVLVLAKVSQFENLKDTNPQILGAILITDVIRPNAKDTFKYFNTQGVDIKVISGDDPATVSAIASQADIKNSKQYVDMSEIDENANLTELIENNTIFGRVTPDQKYDLIKDWQDQGHVVAMTGDGVNDLLALRQADCGIAMASGSESTKSIADFVLIDSNFDAMIGVLNEGRRVINNIERVASMYLIKTMYSVALSLLFIFVASGYPFEPIQLTPITTLMVGIPSFFLALQPNFKKISDQFLRNIMLISTPAAITIVGYIIVIEVLGQIFGLEYMFTSTLSVLLTGAISWIALVMVSRPFNRFKLMLDGTMLVIFLIIIIMFNRLFSLVSFFNPRIWLFALPLILTSYFVFRFIQELCIKFVNRKKHNK
ncbi:HAD-IC family P-type ATPase [Lentilactobacillus laojiaonis]|uniref:HAD-IC family P-type ATPase n=1 Tax=Lentilactobacillus laojiaonis TaxID=2883998 RepID=UPI001D09C293|nr:HAD-IC family P-type ATPase [Lentilactobacillus laojiaonis]UDM32214.1 HAD-IC family P-type ATPase [Lentilactobacillus laojiaonis]